MRLSNQIIFSRKDTIKELWRALLARYIITLIAIGAFILLKNSLPFPWEPFVIMLCSILFLNSICLLWLVMGFRVDTLNKLHPIIDIIMIPFSIHYSGGFISIFMPVYVALMFVTFLYTSMQSIINLKLVFFYICGSYTTVSLLHKFTILPIHAAFEKIMIQDNLIFYTVFITMIVTIAGSYSFLLKLVDHLEKVLFSQQKTVEGTSSVVGEKFFKALIQNLTEAFDATQGFIGTFDRKKGRIEILALYANKKIVEGTSFTVEKTPFITLIDAPFISISKPVHIPLDGDGQHYSISARTLHAISMENAQNDKMGVLAVIDIKRIENDFLIESFLKVFSHRAAAELERLQAEDEKYQLQTQLFQSQKMEAIGLFASNIAHDFNNNIQNIYAYTELINTMDEANPSIRNNTNKIIQATDDATKLIQQLLSFTKKRKQTLEKFSVNNVILELINMFKIIAGMNTKIDSALMAYPDRIVGDSVQLQNALLNLAVNARDAMPNGGELRFTTRIDKLSENSNNDRIPEFKIKEGDFLSISVADTGMGINNENMQDIFKPFFTTKPEGKGTGLGLSSVTNFVVNHKGTIKVKSKVGMGTTITLFLPIEQQNVASTS